MLTIGTPPVTARTNSLIIQNLYKSNKYHRSTSFTDNTVPFLIPEFFSLLSIILYNV